MEILRGLARQTLMAGLLISVSLAVSCLVGCADSSDDVMVGQRLIAAEWTMVTVDEFVTTNGVVEIDDNGCWLFRDSDGKESWFIWPLLAKHEKLQDPEVDAVRLLDGRVMRSGTEMSVQGAYASRSRLPEGAHASSPWALAAQHCLGDQEAEQELFMAASVTRR